MIPDRHDGHQIVSFIESQFIVIDHTKDRKISVYGVYGERDSVDGVCRPILQLDIEIPEEAKMFLYLSPDDQKVYHKRIAQELDWFMIPCLAGIVASYLC
jgi:hypothetical protein